MNHSCATLYDGIILQSYVLIAINVILFTILKAVFENFLIPAVLWLAEKALGKDNQHLPLSTKDSLLSDSPDVNLDARSSYDLAKKFFSSPKIIFLLIQTISALVSIVFAGLEINYSQSKWNQYQNFYGLLVNSSVLTLFISAAWNTLVAIAPCQGYRPPEEDSDIKDVASAVMFFSTMLLGLLLLPAFVSHIIPAMVIYCWTLVPFMIIFALIDLFLSPIGYCSCFGLELLILLLEVLFRLFCIFLLQTAFNYMTLFYEVKVPMNADQYINVIVDEYHLRTQTHCLLEHYNTNTKTMLVFFNWF